MAAASAAAPMFTTVIPTSRVTSSSCGLLEERLRAGLSSSLLSASSLQPRAAEREVRGLGAGQQGGAEQERARGRRAQQEEAHRGESRSARSPARIGDGGSRRAPTQRTPGARLDLADHGQRRARGLGEAARRGSSGRRRAGEQELVVLAAAGGPIREIAAERPRGRADRGDSGSRSSRDARAHAALAADVREVGGEAVGERRSSRGRAGCAPSKRPSRGARARPQVRAHDRSRRRAARQPGRRRPRAGRGRRRSGRATR